jgi:phage terminase large subunit-like protein
MLKAFDGYPNCKDAYIYANHVVNGHKPACKWERLACQRFLDDLNRDFEFVFDPEIAEKYCRFIQKLPHTKGRWAAKKEKLSLGPWQKFIVCNLFGWVDQNGKRRFRKAYLKIPRKNGKSLLAAAIGIAMLCFDGEFGAEVYSGATTEKQAWEVFGPARLMCKRTPELCEYYGIEVNARNINILGNGSKFEPIIGNPGDGSSPSCSIHDEYHEHDTDDQVETMETGMGAREQPLMLQITTAGNNIAGPCYMAESEYKKLLDRVYVDERTFVLMYGIDEDDDWTTDEALIKANPNYDVSVSAEFLRAQQKEAIRNASKQNAFKRKHLNVWVGAHTAFFNMEDWARCCDKDMKIDDFSGDVCVFSLDLASRIDVVAYLKIFSRTINGKQHYYCFPRFYLPEETVLDEKNAHYQKWVNEGYLTATDGDEINFNEIETDIREDMPKFSASELVYDPWRATQLAQRFEDDGALAVEFRNTVNMMSPPMYELEAAIASKRIHHDGNPVMTWMISNVVAKRDAKDNVYPRKEKEENKIDGAISLIMGIGRLMHYKEDYKGYTVSHGVVTV